MAVEKITIVKRWSWLPSLTVEIDCDPGLSPRIKLGLAVKVAYETGAVLTRAVLTDAVLTDAVLTGAVLTRAVLTRAVLTRAVLTGEDLRPFKADHWLTLAELGCTAVDAAHLIAKLKAGEIDGSTYGNGTAKCACLVGTLAHGRDLHGEALDHGASRPAERWFMMIRPGQKPGDGSGGGLAAQRAVEWTEGYCTAHGITLPVVEQEQPF